MTQERLKQLMQDTEINELTWLMNQNYLKQQIEQTKNKYRQLNTSAKKGQIVFAGSSLMEYFPIGELQLHLGIDRVIYNRGIAGTKTTDLLSAMETCIFDLEPSKLFINIGSNDIGAASGYDKEQLLKNYKVIMDKIEDRLPRCQVYVMAYYPVNGNADFGLPKAQKDMLFATRTNEAVSDANVSVERLSAEHDFQFIDVNAGLQDEAGNLKESFTIDGIHMWPEAYTVILENMKGYLQEEKEII